MPKEQVSNTYFKQGGPYISGRPLPTDEDGKVRSKTFIKCSFHPNCNGTEFIDCEFHQCDGDEWITSKWGCKSFYGNGKEKSQKNQKERA